MEGENFLVVFSSHGNLPPFFAPFQKGYCVALKTPFLEYYQLC